MPRPPLKLTDDEARQVVAGVTQIEQLHPLDGRNHKPFLRAFVGLLYRVTGRTFSPAVYRRMLNAFAPGRTPSTTTIALEKDRFVEELERQLAQSSVSTAGAERPPLASNGELEALQASIAQLLRRDARAPDSYLQQQCAFLQQRLNATEKDLAEAQVTVARMRAEQTAAQRQSDRDREEIDILRAGAAALTQELSRLTAAIEDSRKFAMLAIDEARGETRAWKDRCQHAENQVKEQMATTEVFRRLAYRQGADIPPAIDNPSPT